MQAEQLRELATNAQLDHWPPHLGVKTDAEKVEYLAQRLSEVADAEDRADSLTAQLEDARNLSYENEDLKDQIKTLKSDIVELNAKLQEIRDIVA